VRQDDVLLIAPDGSVERVAHAAPGGIRLSAVAVEIRPARGGWFARRQPAHPRLWYASESGLFCQELSADAGPQRIDVPRAAAGVGRLEVGDGVVSLSTPERLLLIDAASRKVICGLELDRQERLLGWCFARPRLLAVRLRPVASGGGAQFLEFHRCGDGPASLRATMEREFELVGTLANFAVFTGGCVVTSGHDALRVYRVP
jgi:hypothetical protein